VLTAEAGPVAGGPAEFGGSFGEFFLIFILFFSIYQNICRFFLQKCHRAASSTGDTMAFLKKKSKYIFDKSEKNKK